MTNKIITLSVLLLFLQNIFAQKVDLDRHYLPVKIIDLPVEPILDESLRTFSFTSNEQQAMDAVILYGFERVDANGNVDADLYFNKIEPKEVNIVEHKEEKKDKDGNVTGVKYSYEAILDYEASAKITYSSPNLDRKITYPKTQTYTQRKIFGTYKDASNYAQNNTNVFATKFQNEFINSEISSFNNWMNKKYGYKEIEDNNLFWILDSESNPEYKGHQQALEDIKNILAKIEVDTNVKELEPEAEKIINYFESVIPKFVGKKRKLRKMRYASYYNIALLYYIFENYDKSLEYAQKVIDNDFDKSDGKKIQKWVGNMKNALAKNKKQSNHFSVETLDPRVKK